MRFRASIGVVVVALFAAGCASTSGTARELASTERTAAPDSRLELLTRLMTGAFSSAAQASAQPEDFRDIRLAMAPVWRSRTDGTWLYVEQAAATSLQEPYRQRIYRLSHVGGDLFESQVFELPQPERFVGAAAKPETLDALEPGALIPREGCAIVLRAMPDGTFVGSTLGRLCASTLRGATYATSEAVIGPGGLVTLDRGWNDAGEQVWGSTAGGYRFDRVP